MQIFESFKSSINHPLEPLEGHSIVIKREDLLHPVVSGNKFRKLKYVFKELEATQSQILLTFGGAFSNHLTAVATAGKFGNIRTIGIVRGQEWQNKIEDSTTLSYCKNQGMELYCVSRVDYDLKEKSIKNENQITLNIFICRFRLICSAKRNQENCQNSRQ